MVKSEFDKLVGSGDRFVVKFSANWCIPCSVLDREINALEDIDLNKIFKVDIEEYPDLADELGVMSIPSLFFIGDGSYSLRKVATAKDIAEWIA
jgi:thioredoxin 1